MIDKIFANNGRPVSEKAKYPLDRRWRAGKPKVTQVRVDDSESGMESEEREVHDESEVEDQQRSRKRARESGLSDTSDRRAPKRARQADWEEEVSYTDTQR